MRTGTLERWILCHLLGRHRVKFGTFPFCMRCGEHTKR
jgi:hypothetical protein